MSYRVMFLCAAVLLSSLHTPAGEVHSQSRLRPVHTYSIVARNPDTGEMGVAVQSHWFSVGSLVAWAESGVGVVATQSFIDVKYGASGLELMRTGWDAEQTLRALLEADPHPEVRQVAMIDSAGKVVAHTGKLCIQHAGHLVGDNVSVQANLMLNDGVLPAMMTAYKNSSGSLAERLLRALEAAQSVGGDIRGKQSAAILVVRGQNTGQPWNDRLVDLNVEDNPNPLKELRRLLTLHEAYEHMDQGDLAIEQHDMEKARMEYGAAQTLCPDNLEMKFWYAIALVNAGKIDEALPVFKSVFRLDNHWALLIPRLVESKLLPSDQEIIANILKQHSKADKVDSETSSDIH